MREERGNLQYVTFETVDPKCVCPNCFVAFSSTVGRKREDTFLELNIFSLFLPFSFPKTTASSFAKVSKCSPTFSPQCRLSQGWHLLHLFLNNYLGLSSVCQALNNAISLGLPSVTMSLYRRCEHSLAPMGPQREDRASGYTSGVLPTAQSCETCDLGSGLYLPRNLHQKFYLLSYWLSFTTPILLQNFVMCVVILTSFMVRFYVPPLVFLPSLFSALDVCCVFCMAVRLLNPFCNKARNT